MIRTILVDGDSRLLQVSKEIIPSEFNTKELDDLITDMIDTMHHADGVGIAAVQIGVHKRILLIEYDADHPRYKDLRDCPLTVVINPEIETVGDETCDYNEGCLSVPGMRGLVTRPKRIKYSFYDAKGNKIEGVGDDFFVRALQHEIDHLNGILFPTRVTDKSTFVKIQPPVKDNNEN